jgi:nucleoid DNA-binding protein
MNMSDLVDSVAAKLNLIHDPARCAKAVVPEVFDSIRDALLRGEDVRITGFGVFKRVATKARACHNPRTGEAIEVPAGYRAKFRPSSKLLEG